MSVTTSPPHRSAENDAIPPWVAERIVLHRAREGSLYRRQYADEYYFEGRWAPEWLARAGEKAREAELVQCGPDGPNGMQVTLTDAGRERYETLQDKTARASQQGNTRLRSRTRR